ncbi:MAG: hypothetical protein M3Q36_00645 [bacterium]|nr:hypothetical protein [bacterium]
MPAAYQKVELAKILFFLGSRRIPPLPPNKNGLLEQAFFIYTELWGTIKLMQEGQQPNDPGWVFRPGDTLPPAMVTPSDENVASTAPVVPIAPPQPAAPVPVVSASFDSPVPTTPAPSTPQPVSIAQNTEPEQTIDQPQADSQWPQDNMRAEWTASEFIASPKNSGWFGILAAASLGLTAIVFLVTRDLISTVVTPILGVLLGVFAARQPRTLQYRIDNHGIYAGERFYSYGSFKSFSIAHDQAMGYISLMPLKRFMPPLSIHYEPKDEDQIASALADYLPYEEHKTDLVDSLTRKFRF